MGIELTDNEDMNLRNYYKMMWSYGENSAKKYGQLQSEFYKDLKKIYLLNGLEGFKEFRES